MLAKNKTSGEKIMRVLKTSRKPLSAYDILARLSNSGIKAPPTVYRALDQLIKQGAVHKIESLNAFVCCQSDNGHTHVSNFAVCKTCGEVTELHGPGNGKLIVDWATERKFTLERAAVELVGYCSACLQTQAKH